MGLFDSFRGFFNPKIINYFDYLYGSHYDALKYYCDLYTKINLSGNISFKDKKFLVENESSILRCYKQHKENKRKRDLYNSIKILYPKGFNYFEKYRKSFSKSLQDDVIEHYNEIITLDKALKKYELLKEKYPLGLPAFEAFNSYDDGKNSAGPTIEEIVECESEIKIFEENAIKNRLYGDIESSQKAFSSKCRSLKNTVFPNWGCYIYKIPFKKISPNGKFSRGEFSVWQLFCDSYSEPDDVDISYFPSWQKNKDDLPKLIRCSINYKEHIYDKIIDFINKIKGFIVGNNEICVVFGDSGVENPSPLNDFHFGYFVRFLNDKNIRHYSLYQDSSVFDVSTIFIIVELISTNERLRSNCSKIIDNVYTKINNRSKSAKLGCNIVYISLCKAYDREEIQEIIESKAAEIEKKKYEEEKKRQEEQQKTEKISKAKHIYINNTEAFKRLFPNLMISSITIDIAEQILKYERKIQDYSDFIVRIKESVSDWDTIKGIPYYYFYHYYPVRFTDITYESRKVRELIYNFKDGIGGAYISVANIMSKKLHSCFSATDLQSLTLVCIPASTILDNKDRYLKFSNRLCNETGMRNSFNHIHIIKEKTQSHLGGTDSAEYSYDNDFFRGANVILFDDVVTRGRSMAQMKCDLESLGASVVCAISIGRTYSDYYGDDREPHPWTGEY